MSEPLITVEDAFDIPAFGGIVIVPGPLQQGYTGPFELAVSLKRPDGQTRTVNLRMQHIFQSPPPKEFRWACILTGISKLDVPVGTEVRPEAEATNP